MGCISLVRLRKGFPCYWSSKTRTLGVTRRVWHFPTDKPDVSETLQIKKTTTLNLCCTDIKKSLFLTKTKWLNSKWCLVDITNITYTSCVKKSYCLGCCHQEWVFIKRFTCLPDDYWRFLSTSWNSS